MKVLKKPVVRLTQKAYQQMLELTKECPIEISAMGVLATNAHRREQGVEEQFYVLSFHVPDQECTPTTTVIETDSLSHITFTLMDQGIKPEQICVWWHSHVDMPVEHSTTDEKQIEDFDFDEVCISIITNKSGKMNVRVDVFKPVRFTFEKCDYIVDQINILGEDWAKNMVDTHIREVKPKILHVNKGKLKSRLPNYNWAWNEALGTPHGGYGFEEKVHDVTIVKDIPQLPKKLRLLENLYEDDTIDINQLLDYHAKWYSGEQNIKAIRSEVKALKAQKEKEG